MTGEKARQIREAWFNHQRRQMGILERMFRERKSPLAGGPNDKQFDGVNYARNR